MNIFGAPDCLICPFPTGDPFPDVAQSPRTTVLSPPPPLPYQTLTVALTDIVNVTLTVHSLTYTTEIWAVWQTPFPEFGENFAEEGEEFSGSQWTSWGPQMVRSAPSLQGIPFPT
jgi:hypothetical protein